MTIKELANKIGYTDAYVSQIETGKVVPSIKVLEKIVDALDLSFREIINTQNHDDKFFLKVMSIMSLNTLMVMCKKSCYV